jgi:hypothetical protein
MSHLLDTITRIDVDAELQDIGGLPPGASVISATRRY